MTAFEVRLNARAIDNFLGQIDTLGECPARLKRALLNPATWKVYDILGDWIGNATATAAWGIPGGVVRQYRMVVRGREFTGRSSTSAIIFRETAASKRGHRV